MRAPNWRLEVAVLRRAWAALRAWLAWLNGDVAYQRFVAHQSRHHPERPSPSRAEFYRMEVERRWNGIRRCC
jgi:uncharacterized short protein YbdD (DUF466 family)